MRERFSPVRAAVAALLLLGMAGLSCSGASSKPRMWDTTALHKGNRPPEGVELCNYLMTEFPEVIAGALPDDIKESIIDIHVQAYLAAELEDGWERPAAEEFGDEILCLMIEIPWEILVNGYFREFIESLPAEKHRAAESIIFGYFLEGHVAALLADPRLDVSNEPKTEWAHEMAVLRGRLARVLDAGELTAYDGYHAEYLRHEQIRFMEHILRAIDCGNVLSEAAVTAMATVIGEERASVFNRMFESGVQDLQPALRAAHAKALERLSSRLGEAEYALASKCIERFNQAMDVSEE